MSQKSFKQAHDGPSVLTPQQYFNLLEQLVTKGEGAGKIQNITAFKLPPITVETLTNTGAHEALNKITVQEVYITFDRDKWPVENDIAVNAAIEDLGKKWGQKTVKINRAGETLGGVDNFEAAVEEEVARLMGVADLSEAGVYVNKAAAFEDDYISTGPGSTDYTPNPNGKRVAIDVTEDIVLPVSWFPGATFNVPAGGSILTRERAQLDGEKVGQFPELAAAIKAVKEGKMKPEEALYDAEGVPKFDVWGTHPGFRRGTAEKKGAYGDVDLNEATYATMQQVAQTQPPKRGLRWLLG